MSQYHPSQIAAPTFALSLAGEIHQLLEGFPDFRGGGDLERSAVSFRNRSSLRFKMSSLFSWTFFAFSINSGKWARFWLHGFRAFSTLPNCLTASRAHVVLVVPDAVDELVEPPRCPSILQLPLRVLALELFQRVDVFHLN